jgi:predicted DNA-binding transcriptional regulator AlpA
VSQAAQMLGIGRATLYRKIAEKAAMASTKPKI